MPEPIRYHSSVGGLWTDRIDAREELARRVATGLVTPDVALLLTHWITAGFVILPGAVDADLCDSACRALDQAWVDGHDQLQVVESFTGVRRALRPGDSRRGTRAVDAYAFFEPVRELLFAEPITSFLRTIFEDAPLLFQSLSFEVGSEQGVHQDTAFVVVDRPMHMAASWIALEDVEPGAGELVYYPGSHRLPEKLFSGLTKHWNEERDGREQLEAWHYWLHDAAKEMGLELEAFLPAKGDVLIWSADLAHGGRPLVRTDATRKSLVGHYCPMSTTPYYMSYLPQRRTRRPFGAGRYSSQYYDLPGA